MFLSEFGSIIEGLAGGPGIFDDQPYLIIQKGGGCSWIAPGVQKMAFRLVCVIPK